MSDPDLPEIIGKCRILSKLGQGGMGVVYKGRHTTLDIDVAVKVLSAHLVDQPGMAERFMHEARLTARLNHPEIIRVLDCDREEGRYYLIMEYVDGRSLQDMLDAEGTVQLDRALEIAEAVARALGAALDEVGIIHRDIKPDNIMITSKGGVKVADLGLAKIVGDASSGMTGTGVGMGTPQYMSPEQFEDARSVDHRADIFSLGVTLYHMLTGRRPFAGETLQEILRKVLLSDPPPLPPSVPPAVQQLIARMLAKNAEQRFQTYGELLAAIDLAKRSTSTALTIADTGAQATPPPVQLGPSLTPPSALPTIAAETSETLAQARPRRVPVAAIAGGAAAVLALVVVGVLLMTRGNKPAPASQPVQPDPLEAEAKDFYNRQKIAGESGRYEDVQRAIQQIGEKYNATAAGLDIRRLGEIAAGGIAEQKREAEEAARREKALADALAQAEQAEKTKNFAEAIRQLEQALTLKDDDALRQRLTALNRHRQAADQLAEAEKNFAAGRWSSARARYLDALKDPAGLNEAEIRARLELVEQKIETENVLAKIGQAVARKRWKDAWDGIASARRAGIDDPRLAPLAQTVIKQRAPPKKRTGPLGVELVLVSGDSFQMGSSAGFDDERPVHTVTISSFYIGTFEVTQAQFEASRRGLRKLPGQISADGHRPAVSVSWRDAVEFCRRLATNDSDDAVVYRLPTEAEWEFAARGPERRVYPWGDQPPTPKHANLAGQADNFDKLAPVGSFPQGATPTGIHDMIGNAAEWCTDWYAPYAANSQIDPFGPSIGTERVLRGSSFAYKAKIWSRAGMRVTSAPTDREPDFGFRVVRELTDDEKMFARLALQPTGQ